MATLATDFLGIRSPNPFWLASGPPTDKEYNVRRAFEAGWGGVVWKTLGEQGPPLVNVNGPRYGAVWGADRRVLGLNNIELITDRPLELNLREIKAVKRDYPDRAVVVSMMVPCEEPAWRGILAQVEQTGADGVELNFGCPHGMNERGMGSAVGQVPEYIEAEYIALGCGNVQVCTAAMVYGFRIVEEMIAGLQFWMEDKGYERLTDFQGRAVRNVADWQHLNLNCTAKARIDQDVCIKCGRCYAACEDTSHQSIAIGAGRVFEVIDEECVACNLCVVTCPVEGCITMESLRVGVVGPRTGKAVEGYANWTTHPNNPLARMGRASG